MNEKINKGRDGLKMSKKKTFLRLRYGENFQNHLNCTMSRQ